MGCGGRDGTRHSLTSLGPDLAFLSWGLADPYA
jgi:hypothetical protein